MVIKAGGGSQTFFSTHGNHLPSLSGVHGLKDFLHSDHLLEWFDGRSYSLKHSHKCKWAILSYSAIFPNHASWILRFLRGTPSTYPGSCDFQRRLLISRKFLLQIWRIWAILRPFYPWSFFDSGIISKKKSPKTHFWGPFHNFFSRIPNNSLKKCDFIKNMSMPKVENQKLQEQKSFSKNGH